MPINETNTETKPADELISRAEHEALLAAALDSERKASAKQLRDLRADYMIRDALRSSGAKNPALLRKMIEISEADGISDGDDFEENVTAQVNARIEGLKASDPYLFDISEDSPKASESAPGKAVPDADSGKNTSDSGAGTDAAGSEKSEKLSMFFTSGAPHGSASQDLSSLSDAEYYRVAGVICF